MSSDIPSDASIYRWYGSARTGSNIDSGKSREDPAVYMITAVSPIAFPVPSMIPVVIPGMAPGSTTCLMVCHLVAPSARLLSFRPPDIVFIASSEALIVQGSIMNINASPPERIEKPNPRYTTRNAYPKRPITIDGIPARHSTQNVMICVTALSGAYSVRYTAAPIPIGAAVSIATATRQSVPTIAGKIPPSAPPMRGESRRNEISITPIPR